jgi:hypothetical protein
LEYPEGTVLFDDILFCFCILFIFFFVNLFMILYFIYFEQQSETELEDPERIVLFDDIRKHLFRFTIEELKTELLFRFLEFLGILLYFFYILCVCVCVCMFCVFLCFVLLFCLFVHLFFPFRLFFRNFLRCYFTVFSIINK